MGEENGSQPRETSRETRREALGGQSDAARPWTAFATPLIGKAVRGASRLLRHGGSAFPGRIVEQIDPGFLARTLADLPYGVVLVSGTNGKTTTTRMVASMLETLGLKVFTNPTGSNFTRGVVSALLTEVPLSGRLDADVAVLELDEAYAVKFVQQVKPRFALLLNVMRDQLDRFGEIDNTARLLERVAEARRAPWCSTVRIRESRVSLRPCRKAPECAISGWRPNCVGSSPPTTTCRSPSPKRPRAWPAMAGRRQMTARSRSRQAHRFRLRPPMPMGARRRPMSR